MPKSTESINTDLEDLLTTKGFEVTALDSSGKETPTADTADLFQFHFHKDGKDYGTVTVTIDGLQKLTVYYDDQVADSGINESDSDRGLSGTSWISLVKNLKKFALRHQLGFVLKDTDRLRTDMKRRNHTKKLEEGMVKKHLKSIPGDLKDLTDEEFKEKYKDTKKAAREYLKSQKEKSSDKADKKLDEGYYGNRKMSYSDDTPTVKMIIKHNRQLEETDQRFRHIERIFLETSAGERFAVDTKKPSRARMFARHLAEGGQYKDERWSHLQEINEDLDKLGGFVRATRSGREQFNEGAQRMISEAAEQYANLRETVKHLSSSRGYNKYFESYEPREIMEDDGDDMSGAFKHSTLDERIEQALPTLKKFGIRQGKLDEADMFEDWANELVSEALDPDTPRQVEDLIELLADFLPVGPNADNAIGELDDVIEDDELYERLRRAAKADPDADARPQIISWMQEQDDEKYRQALDKLEDSDADSEKDQDELEKSNAPQAEEPAKPKKKKPQSQDTAMPPLPGGAVGGMPPLPPLPPLAENSELAGILRLLGK